MFPNNFSANQGPQGLQGLRGLPGKNGKDGRDGAPGASAIIIKGSVPDPVDLPLIDNNKGDCYIVDGDLYAWSGLSWVNVGHVKGPAGLAGLPGLNGNDGLPGLPGAAGRDGIDGLPGLPGLPGAAGRDGIDGLPGLPGIDGLPGRDGIDGLPGLPGAAGRDGIDGLPGLPGAAGRDGIDGLPGLPGAAGRDGIDGLPGLPGLPGRDGIDGLPGRDGIDGLPGLPGRDGIDGLPGATGRDGLPGATGRDGLPGAAGRVGIPGAAGRDGLPGATGSSGTNGTSISLKGPVGSTGLLPASGNTQGDCYIVTDIGNLYSWTGTTWSDIGHIKGPAGANGAAGATGSSGTNGTNGTSISLKGPVGSTGLLPASGNTQGDCYIVTDIGNLYSWTGTTWSDMGHIKGPAGANGAVGATGSSGTNGSSISLKGPVGSTGELPISGDTGDSYVVTDIGNLYSWTGTTWSDMGHIKGPSGKDGIQGVTGISNSNSTNVTITDSSLVGPYYPTFVSASGAGQTLYADIATNPLSYNASTGTVTSKSFVATGTSSYCNALSINDFNVATASQLIFMLSATQQFGYSVSISSDGTIVAVGIPNYYITPQYYVSTVGKVNVYAYLNGSFSQLGSSISVGSAPGYNPIVAGGAVHVLPSSTASNFNSIYVATSMLTSAKLGVFTYNGTSWIMKIPTDATKLSSIISLRGGSIKSYNNSEFLYFTESGYRSVWLYDLNGNITSTLSYGIDYTASAIDEAMYANIIAVGYNDGYQSPAGCVIFTSSNRITWTGFFLVSGTITSVAVSPYGTTVLVGTASNITVYNYVSTTWNAISTINVANSTSMTYSLDGKTLGIGLASTTYSTNGSVKLFETTNWTEIITFANSSNYNFGRSVSLSSNGTMVAIGSAGYDSAVTPAPGTTGAAYIYKHSANVFTNGNIGAGSLGVTGTVSAGSLAVTSGATFASAVYAGSLGVTGGATFGGAVNAGSLTATGGATFAGAVYAGSLGVTGGATFAGAVYAGSLGVTGGATFGGAVSVGSLAVTDGATFGGAVYAGSLGVTGAATFYGTVSGTTFTGALNGNAATATTSTTATNANNVNISNTASGTTNYVLLSTSISGNAPVLTDTSGLSYNSTTNTLVTNITGSATLPTTLALNTLTIGTATSTSQPSYGINTQGWNTGGYVSFTGTGGRTVTALGSDYIAGLGVRIDSWTQTVPPGIASLFEINFTFWNSTTWGQTKYYLQIYPNRLWGQIGTSASWNMNNAINGTTNYNYTNATYAPNGRWYWTYNQTFSGKTGNYGYFVPHTNYVECYFAIPDSSYSYECNFKCLDATSMTSQSRSWQVYTFSA